MMMMNNYSRRVFRGFISSRNLKKYDARNCIITKDNKIYGFSISTNGKVDCRQFYEDYSGIIVYDYLRDKEKYLNKAELDVTETITRISPKGLKAFQAYYDKL